MWNTFKHLETETSKILAQPTNILLRTKTKKEVQQ